MTTLLADGGMDALIAALGTGAPAQPAPEMMLFGQFVGAWDVGMSFFEPDGRCVIRSGEWIFGWALEGSAIQDVWRIPSREESQRSGAPIFGHGTTIRFYDRALGAWRSTWIGVVKGQVIPFIGRKTGDEIHLDSEQPNGSILRWSFSDIRPGSFIWRNQESFDNGATWTLSQEMRTRRRIR